MALRLKEKTARQRFEERLEKKWQKIQEKQRVKKLRTLVWEMLADYANGNNEIFEELVLGCELFNQHWIIVDSGGYPPTIEYQEIRKGLTYKDAAVKYQADFKSVVLWLVHRNAEAGEAAFSFLWKHFSALKVRRYFLNKPFEYGTSLIDSGTLASPLCEFILAGIDRHNRGEEDIPLGVCKNCGKFIAIERQGRKQFCSKNCGVKSFYAGQGGAKMYMRKLRRNIMYKKKQR